MNYEEGNNIHTEIEFFSLTILFLKKFLVKGFLKFVFESIQW